MTDDAYLKRAALLSGLLYLLMAFAEAVRGFVAAPLLTALVALAFLRGCALHHRVAEYRQYYLVAGRLGQMVGLAFAAIGVANLALAALDELETSLLAEVKLAVALLPLAWWWVRCTGMGVKPPVTDDE